MQNLLQWAAKTNWQHLQPKSEDLNCCVAFASLSEDDIEAVEFVAKSEANVVTAVSGANAVLATLWEINPAQPHNSDNTATTSHQVGGNCTQTSANGDQITQNLPQRPTKRATTTRPFLTQKMWCLDQVSEKETKKAWLQPLPRLSGLRR